MTDAATSDERPFSPRTLAARWGCDEKTIRNRIKRGELQAFRAGGKLLRIAAAEVRRCENTSAYGSANGNSATSPANPVPSHIRMAADAGFASVRRG